MRLEGLTEYVVPVANLKDVMDKVESLFKIPLTSVDLMYEPLNATDEQSSLLKLDSDEDFSRMLDECDSTANWCDC